MITINFSSRNYRLFERIFTGLAVLASLLVIVLIASVWISLSLRAEARFLEESVKELEAGQNDYRPLLNERARIMKDLTDMSVLLELRKFSWVRLLTNIEKVFPVGVALNSVELNRPDRSLTLDGTARSPESLRNLIVGLEREPGFRDPYLKHQSLDKGNIAFNVVAIYQEHQAARVASGK